MTIITDDRGGYYPPPRHYYGPHQPSDPKATGVAFMAFGALFFVVGAIVYRNAKKKPAS